MIEAQRQAYLEAMDISVWLNKPAANDLQRLIIGPGSGSTLLVCRDSREASTAVAADVCRYLGGAPIWAWPDIEGRGDKPSLEQAVNQGLYTLVIIWGQFLAKQLIKGNLPQIMSSARVLVVADLDELGLSGDARKKLWLQLSDAVLSGDV